MEEMYIGIEWIIIGVALFSLIIEVISALIIGVRNKWDISMVGLINLITNPIMNSLLIPIRKWYGFEKLYNYLIVIVFEIIVVVLEGLFFKKYWTKTKKNPFVISVIINLVSFIAGLVIQNFI